MSRYKQTFASDGVYRARRSLTVHGVQLAPGDLLPSDSPLRERPGRIETLCRTRMLVPSSVNSKGDTAKQTKVAAAATSPATATPPVVPASKPHVVKPATPKAKPAPVAKKQKIDVDSLTKAEIVSHLEKLGLRTNGGKEQLTERLRIALA